MRWIVALAAALLLLGLIIWRVDHRMGPDPPRVVTFPPPDAPRPPPGSGRALDLSRRAEEHPAPAVPSALRPAPEPGAKAASLQPSEIAAKERTLDEILRSGNDNDPRLDSDFNNLSPETRRLFRQKYRRLPAESRNARGTIVYLLGKNLDSAEDWAFLRESVLEPPCLSLADCAKEGGADDGREDPGTSVTLAYPALVVLKQAERVLEEARFGVGLKAAAARRQALALVRAAKASRVPIVVTKAVELETRF